MDRNSNEMGLVAYNFEPEHSEEEMMSRSQNSIQHSIAEASSADGVGTLEEWCSCGNCQQMPISEECVCCKEADFVLPNLDDHECITQLDSYDTLILNLDVLSIAFIQMMMFKRQCGRAPDE